MDRIKGTIINQDNSGTVGVGAVVIADVGVSVGSGIGVAADIEGF
jgi:hypothetical protein